MQNSALFETPISQRGMRAIFRESQFLCSRKMTSYKQRYKMFALALTALTGKRFLDTVHLKLNSYRWWWWWKRLTLCNEMTDIKCVIAIKIPRSPLTARQTSYNVHCCPIACHPRLEAEGKNSVCPLSSSLSNFSEIILRSDQDINVGKHYDVLLVLHGQKYNFIFRFPTTSLTMHKVLSKRILTSWKLSVM